MALGLFVDMSNSNRFDIYIFQNLLIDIDDFQNLLVDIFQTLLVDIDIDNVTLYIVLKY